MLFYIWDHGEEIEMKDFVAVGWIDALEMYVCVCIWLVCLETFVDLVGERINCIGNSVLYCIWEILGKKEKKETV